MLLPLNGILLIDAARRIVAEADAMAARPGADEQPAGWGHDGGFRAAADRLRGVLAAIDAPAPTREMQARAGLFHLVEARRIFAGLGIRQKLLPRIRAAVSSAKGAVRAASYQDQRAEEERRAA